MGHPLLIHRYRRFGEIRASFFRAEETLVSVYKATLILSSNENILRK
jgi:hypothetical protein